MRELDGFLSVCKPRGMTSFDVIRFVRRLFAGVKTGHAGTLDPDATGLLILAFGNATRLLQYLQTEPKVYRFIIKFGDETDTLDSSGSIVFSGGAVPTADDVRNVLHRFTGPQMQKPPAYSAVKYNGRRAYDLARKGKAPDLEPRSITIDNLTLLRFDETGSAECEVTCSGGTYVRSLARDISRALGTYGHTTEIHRISCGLFSEQDAVGFSDITEETLIIPIHNALRHIQAIEIDEMCQREIRFGRDIDLPEMSQNAPSHVLALANGQFIALLSRAADGRYHPSVVNVRSEGKKQPL